MVKVRNGFWIRDIATHTQTGRQYPCIRCSRCNNVVIDPKEIPKLCRKCFASMKELPKS